jgi:phospholipase C
MSDARRSVDGVTRVLRNVALTALPALALIGMAACGGGGTGRSGPPVSPSPTPPPGPGMLGKFDHVVVIVQENRTVDNLFNGYPGADTVRKGRDLGHDVELVPIDLQPAKGHDHTYQGFVADYDGGEMDGFNHKLDGPSNTSYAYVKQADVHNYWELASRFVLADYVFQMNMGPSFAAHVNLIAAQGGYPFAFAGNESAANRPPGCLGDAHVKVVDMRDAFPGAQKIAPACIDVPTIFDLLDAKGVSWRYYAPNYGIGINFWSAPDYVRHLALGPQHANLVSPETQILKDIAAGSLPAVSYVIPEACSSDHPHSSPGGSLDGPKWVAEVTNAIGKSPYWDRTLILVTWDDWGGWYDHVPPPIEDADQLGFRIPMLVISAHPVRPGAVDHTSRNQASIMTAIEAIFGLGSLGQLDAKTDDLAADFQFATSAVPYGSPLPSSMPPPRHACRLANDGDEEE